MPSALLPLQGFTTKAVRCSWHGFCTKLPGECSSKTHRAGSPRPSQVRRYSYGSFTFSPATSTSLSTCCLYPEDFTSFSSSGKRTEGALDTADKLMQERTRPSVVGRYIREVLHERIGKRICNMLRAVPCQAGLAHLADDYSPHALGRYSCPLATSCRCSHVQAGIMQLLCFLASMCCMLFCPTHAPAFAVIQI